MEVVVNLHKPHPAQKEVIDCQSRFIVVLAGRRFGKSLICQTITLAAAIKNQHVAYITPTYGLGKVFFYEMIKLLPPEIYSKNEQDLVIRFITGGSIRFFTGERLDNLRGLKFHLAIIDEAPLIKNLEAGWNESIRPTLTDYLGRAFFVSTPRGRDFFYSLYLRGLNGVQDWTSFKFTTYDNPFIAKSEVDDAKTQLPAAAFEQEYMANPAENAANPFGSAFIRQCIFPISQNPVVCYGIDLAKSFDFTAIVGLDEYGSVCHFDHFQLDWRGTKQRIAALPSAPILMDSTGVGDPIVEDLQADGIDVTGFKFSSGSKQRLMEGLAAAIHQRKITFPDGAIVNELEVFEYEYTRTGVKYAARSGFHDDCVMGLALAVQHFSQFRGSGKYAFT